MITVIVRNHSFCSLSFNPSSVPYDIIIQEGQIGKYTRMADALAQLSETSGKPPFIFSLCEWGWVRFRFLIIQLDSDVFTESSLAVSLLGYSISDLLTRCSWGATLAHSWRVCVCITVSIKLIRPDNVGYCSPMGFVSQHNQLVCCTLPSCRCFNMYCSNSFITQATDLYGRNDLDMVRTSCSVSSCPQSTL